MNPIPFDGRHPDTRTLHGTRDARVCLVSCAERERVDDCRNAGVVPVLMLQSFCPAFCVPVAAQRQLRDDPYVMEKKGKKAVENMSVFCCRYRHADGCRI